MFLEISDLNFKYGKKLILENINMSVNQGQTLAILGENGAGKTTLLKCINKINIPFSGNIRLREKNLIDLSHDDISKLIAYVSQKNASSRLTVFDAVLMGRKPYINFRTSSKDLKMVDAVLNLLEMKDIELRYIDELSGGELQKVSIARALLQEPELLLLDEPSNFLDLKNQYVIMNIVKRIVKEHNITAIMTMHDLNLAFRFCDSFIFMKKGKIIFSGRSSEITKEIVEEAYDVKIEIHHINNKPLFIPV